MIIGFIGVLIIVKPGGNGIDSNGALISISGVILTAYTLILIKRLSTIENSTWIVFWYTALPAPIVAMFFVIVENAHPPIIWLIMWVLAGSLNVDWGPLKYWCGLLNCSERAHS